MTVMQKTFDSMDKMGPMPGMPECHIWTCFQWDSRHRTEGCQRTRRLKKKKPAQDKKKKTEEKGIFDIEHLPRRPMLSKASLDEYVVGQEYDKESHVGSCL